MPCNFAAGKSKLNSDSDGHVYLPTDLGDQRLLKHITAPQGTRSFNESLTRAYTHALYSYAKQLFERKKYLEALTIVDRAIQSKLSPTFDEERDLHLQICLAYAAILNDNKAVRFYEMAIKDCDAGIAGWHKLDYYIPKIDALLALKRKDEAIHCCEEGYRCSQVDNRSELGKFADYLLRLTGFCTPTPLATPDNTDAIRKDLMELAKHDTCPTQKEIEKLVGAPFVVSFPDSPHLIKREIPNGNSIYDRVSLNLPHKLESPSQINLLLRPEAGVVTEEMVRLWFSNITPTKEVLSYANKLIYEFPWGNIEFSFSPIDSKAACEIDYAWFKSSEYNPVKDSELTQPSLQQRLAEIDVLINRGEFKQAITRMYWQVCGRTNYLDFEPEDVRNSVRNRLLTIKHMEHKPEVVAYLLIAPYQELKETMEQMIMKDRAEFFTLSESKSFPYALWGKLDSDYKGRLDIRGFEGASIASISEKTNAGEEFLARYKLTLPLDKTGPKETKIFNLPGSLLDQIMDEQHAIILARVAERNAVEKKQYDEDSKNPELVKKRIFEARRRSLNPRGWTLDVMDELAKRQK